MPVRGNQLRGLSLGRGSASQATGRCAHCLDIATLSSGRHALLPLRHLREERAGDWSARPPPVRTGCVPLPPSVLSHDDHCPLGRSRPSTGRHAARCGPSRAGSRLRVLQPPKSRRASARARRAAGARQGPARAWAGGGRGRRETPRARAHRPQTPRGGQPGDTHTRSSACCPTTGCSVGT